MMNWKPHALTLALILLPGTTSAGQDDAQYEVDKRPIGARAVYKHIPHNAIQFWVNDGFRGDDVLYADVTTYVVGQSRSLVPEKIGNRASSVKWDLPPGALVMLHADGSGVGGDTIVLWGEGQYPSLNTVKMNDKVLRWTYFDLAVTDQPAEARIGPFGSDAELSESVESGTVALYKDSKFRDDQAVLNLGDVRQGRIYEIDELLAASVSSARWDLPEGVVVILYQDSDGKGRSRALWGRGEVESLPSWDFNDKASHWAWYYVGSSAAADADDQ